MASENGHASAGELANAVAAINVNRADGTPPATTTGSMPTVSNNDPNFKFKYPQARPTPPGADDTEWNKLFTAADSRFYNKAQKNAVVSKAKRESGETYTLALQMLKEKRDKATTSKTNTKATTSSNTGASTLSTTTPRAPVAQTPQPPNEATSSREGTPTAMDMAERIKIEGRARKAASSAPSPENDTPAPPTAPKTSNAPKPRPGPKKGMAVPSKKQQEKKPLSKVQNKESPFSSRHPSHTPGSKHVSSGDESNDGGEYCICRGPDDHRMMVYCEGGCEDWYHCSCVGIDEEDAKELLDRFICPKCTIPDQAYTTFKPMCRYHNVGVFLGKPACRKAAQATKDPPSKYCSLEHGLAWARFILKALHPDSDLPAIPGGNLTPANLRAILGESLTKFQALGEKPRVTKEADDEKGDDEKDRAENLDILLPTEKKELSDIKNKRLDIERRIESYQNQLKLLKMIIDRSKSAAQHIKETRTLCGYDDRLAFNEVQFEKWSKSAEGETALNSGILGPRSEETKRISNRMFSSGHDASESAELPDAIKDMCLIPEKSKCKHNKLSAWKEVHRTDFHVSLVQLREQLVKLEKKYAGIIERAKTRDATKDYYADNKTVQLF